MQTNDRQPHPRKIPDLMSVPLESDKNLDYTLLRNLLAARNWQDADRESDRKVLEVMEKRQRGWVPKPGRKH